MQPINSSQIPSNSTVLSVLHHENISALSISKALVSLGFCAYSAAYGRKRMTDDLVSDTFDKLERDFALSSIKRSDEKTHLQEVLRFLEVLRTRHQKFKMILTAHPKEHSTEDVTFV